MKQLRILRQAPVWINASALILLGLLSACSTSVKGTKDGILPNNLRSMDEIYREHTQKSGKRKAAPAVSPQSELSPSDLQREIKGRVDVSSSCLYDPTGFCTNNDTITELERKAEREIRAEHERARVDAQQAAQRRDDDAFSEWRDVNGSDATRLRQRSVHQGKVSLAAYTREAANEIDNIFTVLPNPTLVMYVFPHLSNHAPVPGYATKFKMYEQDHFALPGETGSGE